MAARKSSRAAGARGRKRGPAGTKRKAGPKRRPQAGVKRKAARGAVKKKTARRAAPKKSAARKTVKKSALKKPARKRATARRPAPGPRATTPARVANGVGLRVQHMDYTTHVLEDVKRFYTETLGFTAFSWDPAIPYLAIQTGPSSSLGFAPPVSGPPEAWRPPREPAIYLVVEDVDRAHRELSSKGVPFEQAPADMPWGHRVAVARDPEGRAVCLAQILRG